MIRGTGAGEPLGIINAPCKIEVSKEVGQVADTIVFENILAMEERLCTSPPGQCMWLVSRGAMRQLRELHQAVGTGGSNVGLLKNGNIAGEPVETMLGMPVYKSNWCSALGDAGDIVLVNAGGIVCAIAKDLTIDISGHSRFEYDQSSVRVICRWDSQPVLSDPVTPEYGSTISSVVTLEAR